MIGLFVIILLFLKVNFILILTYFLNAIAHTQARIKKHKIPAPPTVIAVSVVIPVAPPASSAKISISALASLSIFSASAMIQNYIRFLGLKVLILNFFAVILFYRTFGAKLSPYENTHADLHIFEKNCYFWESIFKHPHKI